MSDEEEEFSCCGFCEEKLQPYNDVSAGITKERVETLPEISIARNPSVSSQCKSPYSGETIQQLSRYEVLVGDGKPYKVIKPRAKNVTWHEPTLGIPRRQNVLCQLCKQWFSSWKALGGHRKWCKGETFI